ncbi:MAG: DNA topoisomerase I [Candidatus Thermoplasmatota archaeon]|nr:DNA topoisomerase I [Candidatus Thermoplasmatota archaeon]
MSLTLIIAEKADAARRISYFLSDGGSKQKKAKGLSYIEFGEGDRTVVIPLSGHIIEIDFPKELNDWKSVNLSTLVDSKILKNVKNRTAYNTLKHFAPEADRIIIATDYDREGELIGVEALDIILSEIRHLDRKPQILRAKFSALTGEEIRQAFSDPITVDYNLADSAEAREEIDLIWGAVLTRFFSLAAHRYGKNFLSIGRVQTPTLALIVKREKEIMEFKPEPYWRILVTFFKKGAFQGEYEGGNIREEETARNIFNAINGKDGVTKEFEKHLERIGKPSPFNTTDFLREASRIGVPPAKAMSIAELLYTRGYISYPRTDNTVYQRSISLRSVLNKLVGSEFSEDVKKVLSQEKIVPSRGRTEAMDHPPIYPVNAVKKGVLKGDYAKIYELILRRFLATLYIAGEREIKEALITIGEHNFKTRGVRITNPGWLELYPYRRIEEFYHPDLEKGEAVKATEWNMVKEETKPPRRYDMASLLKTMEELSLGTKSTRHDIIGKLQDRGFIEGNPVKPTNLGIGLIDSVTTVKSRISEPEMTAELEGEMDRIAGKEMKKEDVVAQSRTMLHSVLSDFKNRESDIKDTINVSLKRGEILGKCPFHDRNIILLKNRDFYTVKCEDESCRINFNMPGRSLIQLLEDRCPICSLPKIKVIRKGQSPDIRCINPKCDFNRTKDSFGECPSDGGSLVVRQSRYGKRFLGCSNYPDCKVTYALPQMGVLSLTGEKCPYCSAPLIIMTGKGRKWKFCPKIDCEYNGKKKKGEKNKKNSA